MTVTSDFGASPNGAALEQGAALLARVRDAVAARVVGQDAAIEDALVAFLARGHLLIEGVPGTAKTLLVRTLSAALGLKFARIQFTPDLMPSDVTGVSMLRDPAKGFEFQMGPVFTDVLLADEINRAPAKTQAALLEAMAERQVTVDGRTRPLDALFTVFATQNPVEHEGTYPLPEAQLARFLHRRRFGKIEIKKGDLRNRITARVLFRLQLLNEFAEGNFLMRERSNTCVLRAFEQFAGHQFQLVTVQRQDLAGFGVSAPQDLLYLLVDETCRLVTAVALPFKPLVRCRVHGRPLRRRGQAHLLAHAVQRHHLAGQGRRAFKVILRPGAGLLKNELFSRPAPKSRKATLQVEGLESKALC